MKKSLKKFRIDKIKLGITFLVFSIVVGFAALNSRLDFFGLISFATTDKDFRVYFSRAFLNDVGKSNIINADGKSITFTYSDINHSDAMLKYTLRNTSNDYFADVEISCKARKKDGTLFEFDEGNTVSRKFRINPATSITDDIGVILPKNENKVEAGTGVKNTTLYNYVKDLSIGDGDNLNFEIENTDGVYTSTNTNSGNKVYFYYGEKADNDVIFAEKCWKVLRTTEDGGVKLIFNGTPQGNTCLTFGAPLGLETSDVIIRLKTDTKYNNNAYAGYMYGKLNAQSYEAAHQNLNDSTLKKEIDKWYENNILGTDYEKYLMDSIQYSNRTILDDYSNITLTDEFTTLGYGTHLTLYESASTASPIAKKLSPSFKYYNKNDSYTVTETDRGNGALKYPISTLTADEMVYAGTNKISSTKSWLNTYGRYLLTLTATGYYNGSMNFVVQDDKGALNTIPNDYTSNNTLYVLPTITLDPKIEILSGSGSNTDPFILSSEDTYENSYTCTMKVNSVGRGEAESEYDSLLDLEVGEEYCFDDECFYTISNDKKGTIKLMAKYNLYVGHYYNDSNDFYSIAKSDKLYGKQHYTALGLDLTGGYPRIGGVAYSNDATDNTYANSNPKRYVDEYVEYLRSITGINLTGELATRDDLINLGCTYNSSQKTCLTANFDWVTGLTYWTMTGGSESRKVYVVGADGFFDETSGMLDTQQRGVRPVITISLTEKNPNITFVSGNGESQGDEICIDDECFYVLNYDGDNYTLFAKYNLYVGSEYASDANGAILSTTDPLYGKQNSLAIGDKGNPVYGATTLAEATQAVSAYADKLNSLYNLHIGSSRFITPSELSSLGCITNDSGMHGCDYPKYANYSWVLNTTYWVEPTSSKVYLVGGDGFYYPLSRTTAQENNNKGRGVRPVIILPVSDVRSSDFLEKLPDAWNDHGIFSAYYDKAFTKLQTMTTSEKVGQLLVMSYGETTQSQASDAIINYHVGGVLFFADAFNGKTEAQVKAMTSGLQAKAKIPLMMPVDEEGGSVTRIASNTNLVSNELQDYPNIFKTYSRSSGPYNAFKSPSDLYNDSGYNFNLIKQEITVKSSVLKRLGLNMNFAPVVDIADSGNFIYSRTLKQNATTTGEFAKIVVNTSKGTGVGYSLKHFPGYGNNADTHTSSSVDKTTLEELWNKHLVPFVAGVDAGAEAVMISHNIVSALDKEYPSSLSKKVHDLLFNDLKFTGLAITDDLSMEAVGNNYDKQYLKAYQAGNHVLLTSKSYATAHSEILAAVNSGEITMDDLNQRVFKVLAWKYYNGLLTD